jgi:hypothetical protein
MTKAKALEANRERQRKYREAHRDEINEQRRERYQNRITDGKCPRCGGKAKKGYTLCEDCCDYQANLNRKYAKDRKKTAGKKAPARKAAKPAKKAPAKGKAAAAKKKPVAKKKTASKAKK